MSAKLAILTQPKPQIDDVWRAWIAENLILGGQPGDVLRVLTEQGFEHMQAVTEIDLALRSPYLQGVRRLRNRLAKHDWVLDIYRKLAQLVPQQVERREQLSREAFLHEYYALNRPVIITGMMQDWPALQKWNLDYFRQHFGQREVEVQFGRQADQDYELNSLAHKKLMRFGEYVDLVESSASTNDFYMTANNDSRNRHALRELWHDVVQVPAYLREEDSQRGFFWFGPKGTITPFHHDLTNNFMAQVMGRKRILMIAAHHVAQLQNQRHCFTTIDGRQIDYQRFPQMRDVPVQEVVLAPGEILFLPVGCWHFVEGLDISVTISFTNFLWENDFFSNYPTDHEF